MCCAGHLATDHQTGVTRGLFRWERYNFCGTGVCNSKTHYTMHGIGSAATDWYVQVSRFPLISANLSS